MKKIKFDVSVTEVGDGVYELLNDLNTLILFNDDLQEELLREISVMHSVSPVFEEIVVGDTLVIGEQNFTITAIGAVALETLKEIGHCAIKFDGLDEVELPGEMQVSGEFRGVNPEDRIMVVRNVI